MTLHNKHSSKFGYFTNRMPQVLQELIDSPLSTIYKCFKPFTFIINISKGSIFYFLIIYHSYSSFMPNGVPSINVSFSNASS